VRRQAFDEGRELLLQPPPRNKIDDRPDERRQMAPQPRLEQEDEGEEDPERFERAAHGAYLNPSPACRGGWTRASARGRVGAATKDPTRRLASLGATLPEDGEGSRTHIWIARLS